ncbi:MAG: hypothetical protein PHE32_00940 [Candidatus Shapirobacteria bacterium]|nr:hypothetical protein [Candidatus Shapirobacteria bacterium]MDD4410258.1 hypothetical protein [Candidatus Shapirobacteria bacterium]
MEIGRGEFLPKIADRPAGVDMNQFKGLKNEDTFSERSIAFDKNKILEKREEFTINHSENRFGYKGGDALESVLDKWANLSGWFGGESVLIKASEFEDYFNGVDFYLEFKGQNQDDLKKRVILAIDATSAVDNSKLIGKIDSAVYKVTTRGGVDIKYYKSAIDGSMGYLKGAIPIVIGVDHNHADDFQIHAGENNFFRNHPDQVSFLEEINLQLDYYLTLEIADEMRTKIEEAKKIMSQVWEEKKGLKKIVEDKTASELNYYVENKTRERKIISESKREEIKTVGKKVSLPYGIKPTKK